MLTRIILAVIVAAVIGLVLVGLLGPLLVTTHIAPAEVLGRFFETYGWGIAILAGIWYFFAGGSFNWPSFGKKA